MRTITTTGHGSVRVAPDAADLRVAAVARAATVTEALAGVEEAVRRAGAAAREHVTDEDVASSDLSVWPQHDLQGQPDGFEARHVLTLRCGSIGAAGDVVAALAERVGDRLVVESVSLVVRDRQEAEDRARDAAYADARRRAEHLARLAEVTLGEVVSASEGVVSLRVGGGVEAAAYKSSLDISFEGGQQTVGTSATVSFHIS